MNDLYNAGLLALAWFAAANAVLSIAAWGLWTSGLWRPGGADGLLALRLLPAAGSALFTILLFAPAHWRFEPRGTDEAFGGGIHVLASTGAWLIGLAAWRFVQAAGASRAIGRCDALPRIVACGAEVYEVEGLNGVSLAGVLRPRIFVGGAVRRALTPAELEAAVAHELAHDTFRDNWKRLALACAPDFFGRTLPARQIERQWSALAECRADARAAAGDPARAAHLASALVKVARLGVSRPLSPAWSTLHDEPLLAERVQRLVSDDTPGVPAPTRRSAAVFGAAALAAVMLGAWLGPHLHALTESLAHLLP